jgi:hypothetical protein
LAHEDLRAPTDDANFDSAVGYLGTEVNDAFEMPEQIEVYRGCRPAPMHDAMAVWRK